MIETIVKPRPLDNDVAVVKILQLMGQLSVDDIKYVLEVCSSIYGMVQTEDRLASAHWVAGEPASSDKHWEQHL
jgi:hypothetical protein